jgi:hypothetical protein
MNNNQVFATLSAITLSVASLSACAAGNNTAATPADTTTANAATVTPAPADQNAVTPPAADPATTTPAQQAPPTATVSYTIKSIDSNTMDFSNVKSSVRKGGYQVSGTARLKSMQHRVVRFPGYAKITLKAADGSEIEVVTANYRSKFGSSKVGSFSAMLKSTPPDGSQIIVEHDEK